MKKILLSAVLLSTLGVTSVNAAPVTSTMDVSATVENVCYIQSLSNVHFDYVPTISSNITRDVSSDVLFNVKCTSQFYPRLYISGAYNENRELTGEDATSKLKYILKFTDKDLNDITVNPDNSLWNTDGVDVLTGGNAFTFNFTVPKGQFVKAQNYAETITVTLSY